MAPKGEFGAHPRYDATQPARARRPSGATEERNAMAKVAVEVPAALAQPLRETVLLLYRSALEGLQLELGADDPSGAASQRGRLRELGELLDQLGWPGPPGPAARTLTAPPALLADALHGALIDAGERLAVACAASWRGEAGPEVVRALAHEVIELARLLREVEPGD
jgi:hypothetical protein